MSRVTLFGKLQEHEMELMRLNQHEENHKKKKGIALKASTSIQEESDKENLNEIELLRLNQHEETDKKKKGIALKASSAKKSRSKKVVDEGVEVPYPVVPSMVRFLDIFRKLEITMPFGEALLQMPLYSKFLKDKLTRKHKYIHQENT